MTKLKWTSTSQYVDVDTGEILTKKEVKENYKVIKTIKKIEHGTEYGYIKYTNECRKSTQGKLW